MKGTHFDTQRENFVFLLEVMSIAHFNRLQRQLSTTVAMCHEVLIWQCVMSGIRQ